MKLCFSLIIPTFNRADLLPLCLESIKKLDYGKDLFEVLVVDNGSTDNIKDLVLSVFSNSKINYRYFYEPEPGLLSGRHLGAKQAQGNIFVFLDDDVVLSKEFLKALSKAFEDKSVKLVGGKCLPRYLSSPPEWLNSLWTEKDGIRHCGYLSLIDQGDLAKESSPSNIWGLNFSIRRETFFELGGFNPDNIPKKYQRYQGDGESGLTRKIISKKYKALYHPNAFVEHLIPASRLTFDYFYNRQFYQGVCDSYTNIRNSLNQTSWEPTFLQKVKYKLKVFFSETKTERKSVEVNISPEVQKLNAVMKKGYQDGYNFHQSEVENDPSLIDWIKKENYLDYKLPI